MNKLFLTGHLGHACVVRDVPKRDGTGSTPVVNFSLAVKSGWGVNEKTIWYACAWWGERAAKVAQWLTKGKKVLLEGEPEMRLFVKRDNSTGGEIAVRVSELELLSGGEDAPGVAAAAEPEGKVTYVPGSSPGGQASPVPVTAGVEDDVAF